MDPAGRVTALVENGNQVSYSYNADDQPTQVQLPGGVTETNGYDAAGRLISRTLGGGGLNSSYTYTYNAAGWLTSSSSSVGGAAPVTTTYTHDAFGHLTGTSTGSSSGTYTYADQEGNLSTSSPGLPVYGAPTTYYTTTAGVLSTTAPHPSSPLPSYPYTQYDTGRTLTYLNGTTIQVTGYHTDVAGRLTGVSSCTYRAITCPLAYATSASSLATMSYNAQGQRASYVSSGTWGSTSERFWYRGGRLAQVATVSGTSAYTDTYVYSPSGAPLELIRQTASAGPCGNTTCRYWYELDGQGSVVALTDSSGHVVDSYSYDAWGAPVSVSEQVPQRLRYRGYWYDAELGTYWLSVRQYDPLLKRFVQPDPSHQEGFASYVYAKSDPVDLADPTGLGTGVHGCWDTAPLPDGICPPLPGAGGSGGSAGNTGIGSGTMGTLTTGTPGPVSTNGISATVPASCFAADAIGVTPDMCGGGQDIGPPSGGQSGGIDYVAEGEGADLLAAEELYYSYEGTATGEAIDAAADNWYASTFEEPEYSLTYHWDTHADDWGTELTPTQYTQMALDSYNDNPGKAREIELRDGTSGLIIQYGGTTGIYRLNADGYGVTIVTFYGPGSA